MMSLGLENGQGRGHGPGIKLIAIHSGKHASEAYANAEAQAEHQINQPDLLYNLRHIVTQRKPRSECSTLRSSCIETCG